MTTDLHVTQVPALVDDLEARILATAKTIDADLSADIKHLAEEVLLGYYARTHLTMVRPLVDEGLDDDEVAVLFTELCALVRSVHAINAQTNGDSTYAETVIDAKVSELLGTDRYVVCVWCDRREDREIGEHCDGVDYCSRECHRAHEAPSECPEGQI